VPPGISRIKPPEGNQIRSRFANDQPLLKIVLVALIKENVPLATVVSLVGLVL